MVCAWLVYVSRVPAESAIGTRVTVWSSTSVAIPWGTTVMRPSLSVKTRFTYLEGAVVVDSQPQVFAVIEGFVADWYTSVIVVRQADAARMISDIFARLV